jgi:hypothetical protein
MKMLKIPRGEVIGEPKGWTPESEADHFMKCQDCGGWIDMRDLGMVFEHDGPLPHPKEDQTQ